MVINVEASPVTLGVALLVCRPLVACGDMSGVWAASGAEVGVPLLWDLAPLVVVMGTERTLDADIIVGGSGSHQIL